MQAQSSKNYKHLSTLSIIFIVVLLISNIVSTKLVQLGPFTFDGGTILFPLSYIFGDILTEIYGYKQSRRVIRMGCFSITLMAIMIMAISYLPAGEWRNHQEAYNTILGLAPRIVVASIIAYLVGEFSNSYVLAKMKIRTKGKFLWTRTLGSTIIGGALDTSIFVLIAFYGIFDLNILWIIILSNYIFKLWIEILLAPLTYYLIRKLKKTENEDFFDSETNFNPIKIN